MKVTISLEEYLRLGGKLENIDFSTTKTTYYDKYRDLSIETIEEGYKTSPNPMTKDTTQLYCVKYTNGDSKNYAGMWISITVDLVLDNKYIK